jgi:hypothetical protein
MTFSNSRTPEMLLAAILELCTINVVLIDPYIHLHNAVVPALATGSLTTLTISGSYFQNYYRCANTNMNLAYLR